ncbi:MAG: aminotransferase class I/II-fold pyridoxal phosphate-dependent enzyme [Thermomicrobiales bacterium]
MLEAISSYQQRNMLPFSTPGHKLGTGLDPELVALYGARTFLADIPVSGGADSIHFNWETWRLAEELGADAWGADRTFYLVNGSSTGNLATLLATIKPDDEVIVARDVHKSLLVALIHSGARPIYVAPRLHPELNIGIGIQPADIAAALARHPEARMVIVVSPSYCGVSSDLPAIARIAHERGVPLYVDEAWGPHFHFHPDLPPSAMSSGADAAVASTHKVLGAFTQSAVLHVQGARIDANRVSAAVGLSQTTSPAAFILATIDACRRQMVLYGEDLLSRTIDLATQARTRLRNIPGIGVLDGDSLGISDYDLTKLVIDVHGLGLTGFQVETMLREDFQINPESSDTSGVICLITIGDTQESISRLVDAFEAMSGTYGRVSSSNGHAGTALRSSGAVIAPGIQAMSPREAFFARSRAIPLRESIGEISAELVIPYPPGIPVFTPGDVITAEKLDYLIAGSQQGMYISGAADHYLETISVVDVPQSPWMPRPFYPSSHQSASTGPTDDAS